MGVCHFYTTPIFTKSLQRQILQRRMTNTRELSSPLKSLPGFFSRITILNHGTATALQTSIINHSRLITNINPIVLWCCVIRHIIFRLIRTRFRILQRQQRNIEQRFTSHNRIKHCYRNITRINKTMTVQNKTARLKMLNINRLDNDRTRMCS